MNSIFDNLVWSDDETREDREEVYVDLASNEVVTLSGNRVTDMVEIPDCELVTFELNSDVEKCETTDNVNETRQSEPSQVSAS